MSQGALWIILMIAASAISVQAQNGTENELSLDFCQRKRRHDCLPDVNDKSSCPDQCVACPLNFPECRMCVTANRACIFTDRVELSAFTTKQTCESSQERAWCGGDRVQECVERRPAQEQCFRKIAELTPCLGPTTLESCQQEGCVWCEDGIVTNKNKCFQVDSSLECEDSSERCCAAFTCLPGDVSEADCTSRGCVLCNDGSKSRCIIPVNGTFGVNDWSNCTRECGTGTQFRYVECTDDSDTSTCKKEYRSCNTDPCPATSITCDGDTIARYNEDTLCCANHTAVCGRNSLNSVASAGSTENIWPWIGAVYLGISDAATATRCAATLVADRLLISSYDCIGDAVASDSLVHVGISDRTARPQYSSTVVGFDHYSEVGEGISGDSITITVIELAQSAPAGHDDTPLCLPNGEEVTEDRQCVVVGWRGDGGSDSCSATLQEASVRVLPWDLCEAAWKSEFPAISEYSHFCAGSPEGLDSCPGEIGGPVMCQRCSNCGLYLAGIATKYQDCGKGGRPSVYLRVSEIGQTPFAGQDDTTYPSCAP